jgi:hypothetical protein
MKTVVKVEGALHSTSDSRMKNSNDKAENESSFLYAMLLHI